MSEVYGPTVVCRDFYVYLHRDESGVPFYVGKGRGLRAYSKGDRSRPWREIALRGYTVEIVRVGLTNEEAKALETDLIMQTGRICDGTGPLVNVKTVDDSFHWRRYYVVEDEAEIMEQWRCDGGPL